jgi:hypothetical protein
MHLIAQHKILVTGNDFNNSSRQVEKFFERTKLVIYDSVQIVEHLCYSAATEFFQQVLKEALQQNQKTLRSLIKEMENTGVQSITDLLELQQGYPSKTLHIIAHLLDGFIGIDSYFYNLLDDSHWLPADTAAAISRAPDRYWLIHIDCYSATPDEAALLHK